MAHPSGRLEPHHVPIRTGDSPTNPKPAAEEVVAVMMMIINHRRADGDGHHYD